MAPPRKNVQKQEVILPADFYYPTLSDDMQLNMINAIRIAEKDPDAYFGPTCPYMPELKAFFVTKFRTSRADSDLDVAQGDDPDEDKWDRLEREARSLFKNLKGTYETMQVDNVQEKMAYFRTATALLEKLVALQERAIGLKQLSAFQSMVIQYLDELATPDQRTELMRRLKETQLSDGIKVLNKRDEPTDA